MANKRSLRLRRYFQISSSGAIILTGISDIVGGMKLPRGKNFLIFLGIVNILIAVIILMNPVILPLLIAWYVLLWGISRLFLSFELKKLLK